METLMRILKKIREEEQTSVVDPGIQKSSIHSILFFLDIGMWFYTYRAL